ncbi:MAG: GLPGLI family protein [Flavobacteriaceae bacterium]|nr:GLPGLI family protein [Flavobacteriaceae bacterium]
MKHIAIIIVMLIVTGTAIAQDFQGVATYKSHRKIDLKINEGNENSEMQKSIQEQLSKQFQQEYTLVFNKNESTYKQNEKLEAPSPRVTGIQIQISQGGADILYKNIKENRFTEKTEIYGKQFLIKDSLRINNWELVNETKNIGEYTCFKAIFSEDYTTQTINDNNEIETVTKERTTIAWYTPQISVNNGPENYHGLPGLILEINDGQLTLICSKIVINPTEKVNIKEPTKGKIVTQQKFDEIMEKKNKEMMERFQSRRGDGESIMIKIGG